MKRLICSPAERFGRGGVDDFKQNAWFKGIDWDNIRDSKCLMWYTCSNSSL